ncbi:MAG: hypothetical protein ISR81_01395 [Nitrosopumilus sp.]|nr:hypothetical protein [Nitrosopumilus sp.]MBL7017549.1 hypothetical protein [Nitrosopumilus sp.]
MFLLWKLILPKINLKYLILILFAIFTLIVILQLTNNPCSVDHIVISNEINSYEKSLDPEFCENILEKIDLYNDQCEFQIEILDCG